MSSEVAFGAKIVSFHTPISQEKKTSSRRKHSTQHNEEPAASPPRPGSPFRLDLTTVIAAREGSTRHAKFTSSCSSSSVVGDGVSDSSIPPIRDRFFEGASTNVSGNGFFPPVLDLTDVIEQQDATRTRSNSLTERGSPKEVSADVSSSSGSLSARTLHDCSKPETQPSVSEHLQVPGSRSPRTLSARGLRSPSSKLTKLARERLPLLSNVRHATGEFDSEAVAREIIHEYQKPLRDHDDRSLVLSTCHSVIRSYPDQLLAVFDKLFYLPLGTEFIYAYLTCYPRDTLTIVRKILENRPTNLDISARLTLLTQLDSMRNDEKPSPFPEKGVSFSFAHEFTQALIPPDIETLTQSIHELSSVLKGKKRSTQIKNILPLIFSMELSLDVKQILEVRRNFFDHKLKESGLDEASINFLCEQMVAKFFYKSVLIPAISNLSTEKIKNSTLKNVCDLLGCFVNHERPKAARLSKIYDVFLAKHQSFISQISEFRFLAEEDKPQSYTSSSSSSSSSTASSPKSRGMLRWSIQSLRPHGTKKELKEPSSSASCSSGTLQLNPLHQKVKTTSLWTLANPEIEFDAEVVAKELTRGLKKGVVAERVIDPLLKQIWHLIQKEENAELKAKLESRLDQLFGALIFKPVESEFVSSCLHRHPNVTNADLFAQAALRAVKTRSIPFDKVLHVYSRVTEQALLSSTEPETLLRGTNLASALYKGLIMQYGDTVFSDYINKVLEHFWESRKCQSVSPEEAFKLFVNESMTSLYKMDIPDEVIRILVKQYELAFQRIQALKPEMPVEEIRKKAMLFMGGELFLRVLNPLLIKESTSERWIMDFAIILQRLTNNTPFNGNSTQIAFPAVCSEMYESYFGKHLIFLDGFCRLDYSLPKPPAV
jgi:hypothetical protein